MVLIALRPRNVTAIFVLLVSLCVSSLCGCKGSGAPIGRSDTHDRPESGSESDREPKSTYGKIVNRAHALQTPSAEQQAAQEQARELLEDP